MALFCRGPDISPWLLLSVPLPLVFCGITLMYFGHSFQVSCFSLVVIFESFTIFRIFPDISFQICFPSLFCTCSSFETLIRYTLDIHSFLLAVSNFPPPLSPWASFQVIFSCPLPGHYIPVVLLSSLNHVQF